MKKITIPLLIIVFGLVGFARGQSLCSSDRIEYVEYKNTPNPSTGVYNLDRTISSSIYKVSQAYYYSGQGRITEVRIFGNYPGTRAGVRLKIGIFNTGPNNKPTTSIATPSEQIWWASYNLFGYHDFTLPSGGVNVTGNFCVVVEVLPSTFPLTSGVFDIDFNGTGEGMGTNLSSVAGTSTGQNWINFAQDADFYLKPIIRHTNIPSFTASSLCIPVGGVISFNSSTSLFTTDSMFNTIGLSSYSGPNTYYLWDFGDGGSSTAPNPNHIYSTAGSHTVVLTTTIVGWNTICQRSISLNISVGLDITASGSTLNCFGDANGIGTGVPSGGVPPYQYSLTKNPGDWYSNGGIFSGLEAGNYKMYVKDNVGCISGALFTIAQPSAIVFGTPTFTNATCGNSNGAFQITATGGSGAKQYSLNKATWQATGNFTNLSSGTYHLYVKDDNNCMDSMIVALNDQGAPTINSYTSQNIRFQFLHFCSIAATPE